LKDLEMPIPEGFKGGVGSEIQCGEDIYDGVDPKDLDGHQDQLPFD
jgi:hypothetical protein